MGWSPRTAVWRGAGWEQRRAGALASLHLVPLPQGAHPPTPHPPRWPGWGRGALGASRHSLAQRAGEAAIRGAPAQAAGAKVVEAIQQAGALELCVAQRAHQRVAARGVQGTQALQGREDSSRHLLGELRKAAGRAGAGTRPRSPRQPPPVPASPSASTRLLPLYQTRTQRGVQRSWSAGIGSAGSRGNGLEACGGVLCAVPSSPALRWWPWKVRPQDRAVRPTQGLASPASTSPTSPHSHPRNSPPGVLWVTCRRHPFLAGPQHCSGAALPSNLPRPAAAPRRRARAAATPRVAPRAEAVTPRLETTAWGEGHLSHRG